MSLPDEYTKANRETIMDQKYKKITVLDNEIEARLLGSILNERDIPHLIMSYYDTAYDGLYQTQKGWGYISAPETFHQEIQEIIASVRDGAAP